MLYLFRAEEAGRGDKLTDFLSGRVPLASRWFRLLRQAGDNE
ncbi:hypothetical protein ACRAKI_09475 [Saccharothrix isguenensis]